MAKFTREEVIQVVLDGRKCVGADLRDIDLSGANLSGANLFKAHLLKSVIANVCVIPGLEN